MGGDGRSGRVGLGGSGRARSGRVGLGRSRSRRERSTVEDGRSRTEASSRTSEEGQPARKIKVCDRKMYDMQLLSC